MSWVCYLTLLKLLWGWGSTYPNKLKRGAFLKPCWRAAIAQVEEKFTYMVRFLVADGTVEKRGLNLFAIRLYHDSVEGEIIEI